MQRKGRYQQTANQLGGQRRAEHMGKTDVFPMQEQTVQHAHQHRRKCDAGGDIAIEHQSAKHIGNAVDHRSADGAEQHSAKGDGDKAEADADGVRFDGTELAEENGEGDQRRHFTKTPCAVFFHFWGSPFVCGLPENGSIVDKPQ